MFYKSTQGEEEENSRIFEFNGVSSAFQSVPSSLDVDSSSMCRLHPGLDSGTEVRGGQSISRADHSSAVLHPGAVRQPSCFDPQVSRTGDACLIRYTSDGRLIGIEPVQNLESN